MKDTGMRTISVQLITAIRSVGSTCADRVMEIFRLQLQSAVTCRTHLVGNLVPEKLIMHDWPTALAQLVAMVR